MESIKNLVTQISRGSFFCCHIRGLVHFFLALLYHGHSNKTCLAVSMVPKPQPQSPSKNIIPNIRPSEIAGSAPYGACSYSERTFVFSTAISLKSNYILQQFFSYPLPQCPTDLLRKRGRSPKPDVSLDDLFKGTFSYLFLNLRTINQC